MQKMKPPEYFWLRFSHLKGPPSWPSALPPSGREDGGGFHFLLVFKALNQRALFVVVSYFLFPDVTKKN